MLKLMKADVPDGIEIPMEAQMLKFTCLRILRNIAAYS